MGGEAGPSTSVPGESLGAAEVEELACPPTIGSRGAVGPDEELDEFRGGDGSSDMGSLSPLPTLVGGPNSIELSNSFLLEVVRGAAGIGEYLGVAGGTHAGSGRSGCKRSFRKEGAAAGIVDFGNGSGTTEEPADGA